MPRHSLTIAVAQPRTAQLDVGANVRAHAEMVRRADARVVVFPEMSLTGYELDAEALDVADRRLGPLAAACADIGTLALAGAPVIGPEGIGRSIGVLSVGADGTVEVAYRKLWLGAAEVDAGFVPGDAPVALDVDGWRLGLAVCKDTSHREHAAATAALGIDAYVAGVVHRVDEADEHERRARRVIADHSIAVAMAAFAGSTGGGYDHMSGGSGIWAADGVELARADARPGRVAVAVIPPPPG